MAVTYRSTGLYNSAGSTTAVITAPSGLVNGDLIFAVIRRAGAVNPTGVPTGWTLIKSTLSTYGFWVYYKVANNEGASWTWTWAASAKTLGRSHAFYGNIDTANPIQGSTTPYSGTKSGTVITIPTLTTSAANTTSVLIVSTYSTSAKTFTVPTSPAYIEHNDTGNTLPDFWQAIATYNYPTSGTATGAIAYPASANSTYRIGCQILINTIPPNQPPSQAILNNPIDGYSTYNTSPTFNFVASDPESNLIEYNIQIDTSNTFNSAGGNPLISAFSVSDAGFTSGHPFASGNSINYNLQTPLSPATYYWRVAAIDPSGSNTYGSWSLAKSLTILPNLKSTVVLDTPTDLSIGLSTAPTLSFTGTDPEGDSIEYQVQIDTANTFDSIIGSSGVIASDSFELTNWTSFLVSGTNAAWTKVTSSTNPTVTSPPNSSNMAKFNSYNCENDQQARFYTNSSFNIASNVDNCSLSFWIFHDTEFTPNNDRVQLQISTNGGTDWVNVGSPASRYNGSTGWQQVTIDLASFIGSNGIIIGFLGISAYGNNCYIDDVVVNYSFVNTPIISKLSTTDTGFSPGHPFSSAIQTSFTVQAANELAESNMYYWRVRAIDPSGSGTYSDWTAPRSFSVGNLAPTVSLDMPVEGQLVSTTPTFNFVGTDMESDKIEYHIQVDSAVTFDSQSGNPLISAFSVSNTGFSAGHPFNSGDTVSYDVQSALSLGTYYWRVAGIDPLGRNSYGEWSTPQSITVVNNAPPYLSLNYPNNGCQGVPLTPTLRFTGTDSENDKIEYHVQVDNVDTFNSNGGGAATTGYSNSFESTNWTSTLVTGADASWTRITASTHPPAASAQNGSYLAGFNSYSCRADASARFHAGDTITITSGAGSARLKFWMYHDTGYTTSNDKIQLQISRTSGVSWVNVGNPILRYAATTGWSQASIDISSYIGVNNIMIAFLGISGYGNDCYIDNVTIEYDLPLINKRSSTDSGFTTGHPYDSGVTIEYKLQAGETLTKNTTYYWRARAIDPLGINSYGNWSTTNSFTPNTGVKIWDGSAWSYKPAKIWTGASWTEKPVKIWDGNSWINKG